MRIDWVAAKVAHGGSYCAGLNDGTRVVDGNDPDSELLCHESGEPVTNWCDGCIGWEAVCELAMMQLQQKEKPCADS